MPANPEPPRMEIMVPWRTILKIFAACLLGYLAVRLSRFIELVLLAILIALAFRPFLCWTERHHWPKWTAVLACALVLLGSTALLFGLLVPIVSSQGLEFVKRLPALKDNLLAHLPASGPLRNMANQIFAAQTFSDPQPLIKQALAWGGAGLEKVGEFFVVLILALYFAAEGGRVYRWLLAFLPESQRRKAEPTADEITEVVGHYVAGNLFTSLLCSIYVFIVLKVLHVPGATLFAVLAGVFDLLPIIGFFMFTIPTTLVALTVSLKTALLVATLYGAYHLAENYFIVPKVYGNRLRLSELTVLISCLAAGLVAGVIGVLLVLPLVACYPIIERYWLQPYLRRETVEEHEQIEAEEFPEK
jgi:predicted PurR-regulated permease PerM